MAYYRRRSFRKRTFRRSRRFNRRRRFARKRRYGRKRMRFTGRPRRWRFVRNAAIQSKGASYLDSLRDWAHERGRHLVGGGLVPALGAAAYSYIDREMKARMPWLQGYYYPPHATDLVLPPQVQAPPYWLRGRANPQFIMRKRRVAFPKFNPHLKKLHDLKMQQAKQNAHRLAGLSKPSKPWF